MPHESNIPLMLTQLLTKANIQMNKKQFVSLIIKIYGGIPTIISECISQPPLIIFNLFFHVVQLSEFLILIVERFFYSIQKEKLLQFSVFGLYYVKQ